MPTEREVLLEHLRRQLAFLARSCAAYDHGFVDEAIRMAVVLRVLFHTTKRSKSLFTQLEVPTIPVISTVLRVGRGTVYFEGMGMFQFGPTGSAYFAKLGEGQRHVPMPAPEWWWQVVSIQGPAMTVRRRDVVLGAANKDGGAHVDTNLTPEYAAISAPGAVGNWYWVEDSGEKSQPIRDAQLVYVRQMAYEVLVSPAIRALAA